MRRKQTPETIEKLRLTNLSKAGKKHTSETRDKLSLKTMSTDNPRILGILAAREYLISCYPSHAMVRELDRLQFAKARSQPCLIGMPALQTCVEKREENTPDRPLPVLSL